MLEARQVAECGHDRHGDGARPPTPGLAGLDPRGQPPGCDRRAAFLLETLPAFGGRIHCADVVLEDELVGGGGPDHVGEPPHMGGAPGGPARIAEIVAAHKGWEPTRGGLEIVDGLCPRAGEVAAGLIFPRGNLDPRQIPRAPQTGQLAGVPPVRLHAGAGLLGHEGGGDDPAAMALFRQITREPGATGTRFIDKAQRFGRGWELAGEVVNGTLARANGPEGGDLAAVILRHVSHGNRVFVDGHSDGQRARLAHG